MLEKGIFQAIDEGQQRIFKVINLYRFQIDRQDIAANCIKTWNQTPDHPVDVSIKLVNLIAEVYQQAFVEDENDGSDQEAIIDAEQALASPEYKRYINACAELQAVEILDLSKDQKVVFFLNIH